MLALHYGNFAFGNSPQTCVVVLWRSAASIAHAVGAMTARLSNMNAIFPAILWGARSAATAIYQLARSGPWPDMQLWSDAPPGTKPPAFAS